MEKFAGMELVLLPVPAVMIVIGFLQGVIQVAVEKNFGLVQEMLLIKNLLIHQPMGIVENNNLILLVLAVQGELVLQLFLSQEVYLPLEEINLLGKLL